ncbi:MULTISPECIES: peptide deformylase [unclassified Crossiella]|uniref:peptide deformylase n=1 Tax=unclassified Crossiella TaxID=2620835 RepID=UPI001FFEA6D7|nr:MULTISPECIES: peptide deformylase [unclassified Crossiella]MCK2237902.1 peptide deformylase [Crossiella sp. S99.2]MCK2255188.1 peptide deformylase [Crossiella sp. S99.1]
MAVHPIVIAGNPVLHNPTRPVEQFDDALRTLIADLYETMAASNGVGLAANQIGVDQRLFVYNCHDDEGNWFKGVVVNPVLETSEIPEGMPDEEDDIEGCLSAPGEAFPTGRADWAKVTGFDGDGNPIEVEGKGFFARCLQHETDHLDGYLYLDRLTGRHKRAAKKALKANGWGVDGLSWMPGEVEDPFGH